MLAKLQKILDSHSFFYPTSSLLQVCVLLFLKTNRKLSFFPHFCSVAKVFSRKKCIFFLDHESFVTKFAEKRHSRKIMPSMSRFSFSRMFLPLKYVKKKSDHVQQRCKPVVLKRSNGKKHLV